MEQDAVIGLPWYGESLWHGTRSDPMSVGRRVKRPAPCK